MSTFFWCSLYNELAIHAPTFLNILLSCTQTSDLRPKRTAVICVCAAGYSKFRQTLCFCYTKLYAKSKNCNYFASSITERDHV